MVQCSSCGKEIDRIPVWMETIKVEYVCNNCPNRQLKNIAFMSLDAPAKPASASDAPADAPEVEEDDED